MRYKPKLYLDGGLNLLAFVACQRPMHQVQVQVVNLEILDSLLASLPDTAMVWVV